MSICFQIFLRAIFLIAFGRNQTIFRLVLKQKKIANGIIFLLIQRETGIYFSVCEIIKKKLTRSVGVYLPIYISTVYLTEVLMKKLLFGLHETLQKTVKLLRTHLLHKIHIY